MIVGTVNAFHEMILRLPIRDAAGQVLEVEVLFDSGFNGSLTLPPSLIATLGLAWRTRTNAVLANGSMQQFDVFTATIIWNGAPRQILVQAIDSEPLLGMTLLIGHDLRARVRAGAHVEIEAIP